MEVYELGMLGIGRLFTSPPHCSDILFINIFLVKHIKLSLVLFLGDDDSGA